MDDIEGMLDLRKVLSLSVLMAVGISPLSAAGSLATKSPSAETNSLEKAQSLYRSHAWDASEIAYLKALPYAKLEERIQIYEGLIQLYEKVRLPRKAKKIKQKLEREKKFQSLLIPLGPSLYEPYTLQKGDSYGKIARKRGISEEWLKGINQHQKLVAGKKIQVPREPYHLIVSKKDKKLIWKRGSESLKTYPVSIGHQKNQTPEGEFTIIEKIEQPTWYHLKEVIPPASPKNLLGTRWLGLSKKGFGIHGTRDPNSIGAAVSHGCIRMYNSDVEELFEWVPIGTKVSIQ